MAPLRSLLIDTGPLVAYLNAKDPAHSAVVASLADFTGQLHTTSAVITEAMHFVSRTARGPFGPAFLAELVTTSAMLVHDFARGADLHDAAALMRKYADIPMDYADATLVLLAERLEILDILTLDRRGFVVFRTRERQPLRMLELA